MTKSSINENSTHSVSDFSQSTTNKSMPDIVKKVNKIINKYLPDCFTSILNDLDLNPLQVDDRFKENAHKDFQQFFITRVIQKKD